MSTGRLTLHFTDVFNQPITDDMSIRLRHRTLAGEARVDARVTGSVVINGLMSEPQGSYTMEVHASSYLPVAMFVTVPSDGRGSSTVRLPVDPAKVKPRFPDYADLDARLKGLLERSHQVKGFEGLSAAALYKGLSDEQRAGLLNIAKKALVTRFTNGAELLPHITLMEVKGDRLYVEIPPGLRAQMPDDALDAAEEAGADEPDTFRKVNGSLHAPPQAGFEPAGSFKTRDAYGNLQLTFFRNGVDHWIADVDIDDAAGLAHVFQVARNHLKNRPTHPYDIHQILVVHQGLDPGYRFEPLLA